VLLERSALYSAGECINDTSSRCIVMTNLPLLVTEFVRLVDTHFYMLFHAEIVYLFRNIVVQFYAVERTREEQYKILSKLQ
jgi:hypothetical protein